MLNSSISTSGSVIEVSSQDCEHLHSWVCVFPSNHLWCSSCSISLSSKVTFSTIPTFNRILVLVLALVLVLFVLSLLSFAFALSVLAFALFALAFAKCTNVHWVVSSWVWWTFLFRVSCICVTSTLTVCFDFFSQDTIRSQSRTVQLYVFLEIIWQQSFKGTHANVFRKTVCISLSISSATVASHEIFHLLDGTHQLRQFHLRRRQNLPQETSCSSRCVRIPPSVQLAPTLEVMVTSCWHHNVKALTFRECWKHHEQVSVYLCVRPCFEFKHTECNWWHPTRSSRHSWPTRGNVLLCLRTPAAFLSLSDRQASFSSVLVNDWARSWLL